MHKFLHIIYFYFKSRYGFLVITLVYLLTIALMLPLRNVGYDDDFAYIRTAERLVKTGELKLSEWAAASIIFQIYWGALFAKIFGFSIKILHLSNIILLYFALISFYSLLKRISLSEFTATIFTLFLLSFPWVLFLTYSYMSDIFYMSLLVISLYFYIKAIQTNNRISFLLGGIFAGFSFIQRQIGIILPISMLCVLIYQSKASGKISWQSSLYCFAPTAIIVTAYIYWQSQTGMTAGQHFSLGPKFIIGLTKSIWPIFNIGHTVISASFYIQTLQRTVSYFYQLAGFLSLIFLIYPLNIKKATKLLVDNKKAILITSLILLTVYLIDQLYIDRHIMSVSPDILYFDNIFRASYLWPKIIFFAAPLWIIALAVTLRKLFSKLFIQRKKKFSQLFKLLVALYFMWAFNHFLNIFTLSIKTKPHFITAMSNFNLHGINLYLTNIDNIPTIQEIFRETWFFFFVVLSLLISITYLFTYKKINFSSKINIIPLFLGLTFILHFLFTVIAAYFYWDNYVIQFIPFIIIWMGYLSRKIKISRPKATLIISLLLILSLETTRNRYQTQGASWELATSLIESGVNIQNINAVNWAWRPYWLFESTFEEAVERAGGDKYKVAQIGQWNDGFTPEKIKYNISTVPFYSLTAAKKTKQIILESKPFWNFNGIPQVIIIEKKL